MHTLYDPRASAAELDAFCNRLVQYVGPTPMQRAHPHTLSARLQAKRTGARDAELSALAPEMMTPAAASALLKHLVATGRLDLAVRKFTNLATLPQRAAGHGDRSTHEI